MLLELKVSQFAIINNIHISFRAGLNIMSGETGAGKSILLKSLALLMGDKASSEAVRSGCEQAVIEGCFDLGHRPDVGSRLQEMGIEAGDGQLVVRRIVAANGKNRIYINGSLSTVSSLRDLVAPLVEVAGPAVPLIELTGQHENRNLLSRAYHLDVLDHYSGVWRSRQEYAELYQRRRQLQEQLAALESEERTRAQRLDFLIYQRDEIKALELRPGEESEIESETKRLKFASKLSDFVAQTEDMLYGSDDSVTSRLHYVLQRAQDLKRYDAALADKLEPLSQAKALMSEVSYELRDYAKSLEADPSRLDALEARLSRLRQLQKKYGGTAEEILQSLDNIETEIAGLENSEQTRSGLEAEIENLGEELKRRAEEMHKKRSAAAKLLAAGVNDELKDLNMKGLQFLVTLEQTPEIGPTGQTSVEFMSQVSKSDTPRSLAKFASGGELSRILLSIKQVAGASAHPRTYLFDEVDTGVSGPTAEKVGRKLKAIAKDQQVICVTHLPQVAAFADAHFLIQKSNARDSVSMQVHELKKSERVQEIARLISGEKITKTSLAHAEQLLDLR